MTPGVVVGTAGHIDHGKTSLVRALTGVDLDVLPEEQERGITIALGFTSLDLGDGRRAALVDVPGHERLVRTMVAGATGLDAVILCVSAVDGAMPQTREHLAILDLLGVEQGAVALTMADLADEEMLELVAADVAEAVAGTFLADAPVLMTSATTGRGLAELRALVAGFRPRDRADGGAFRLPVDRAFVRSGFGTVVTGTSWSGEVVDGATVRLLPGGRSVRVRGIHVHGEPVERAGPGFRVALNLTGVEKHEVPRGTLVVRGEVPEASMIDAIYTHLPGAPDLSDGTQVRVLLGTAERIGNLYVAGESGVITSGKTPVQIRLQEALACLPGDRFILRWASPVETLGGGVVIDPWAPRMRAKRRVEHAAEILRLEGGDPVVWLERAGEQGLALVDWKARSSREVPILADRALAPRVLGRLEGALLEALTEYHGRSPLSLGAHRRELLRGRLGHLDERVFDALVDRIAASGLVSVRGPLLRLSTFSVEPTPAQVGLQRAIFESLELAGLSGLPPKELHTLHPEPEVEALARLLEASGEAVLVPAVGWMSASRIAVLRDGLRDHFSRSEELTPADFKAMTELSRKTAIPLLEWLDRSKWTARRGDSRVRGSEL